MFIFERKWPKKNQKLAEYVNENNIPVFGEKTFYGDAWQNSIDLYHRLRETSPETIIVAGGPQVSLWRDIIFSDRNARAKYPARSTNQPERVLRRMPRGSSPQARTDPSPPHQNNAPRS